MFYHDSVAMSPVVLAQLYANLSQAEGRIRRPYPDSRGYMTLGVGHRIDGGAIPISDKAIDAILEGDVAETVRRCERRIMVWQHLDEIRQATLVEFAFNGALFTSPRALAAIDSGDYELAANALLTGSWCEQVGEQRAQRLAQQLRTGEWAR